MKLLIRRIQRAYPQVWFACHVEHRSRRTDRALTDRDVGILEHIEATPGLRASELAHHLGIGRPALSVHIKRLTQQGYLLQQAGDDAREKRIRLTASAREVLSTASALDASQLGRMLGVLDRDERARAVAGLELLAMAARRVAAATATTMDSKGDFS